MKTNPLWRKVRLPRFPSLRRRLNVDVVVVGGGMTGISAAYLLKKAGRKVALLERDRCARQDTGNTTAHVTYVTDLRLDDLVKTIGRDHAQAVWDAGLAAIESIEDIVRTENIDCEFRRVPGYLHASLVRKQDDTDPLKQDADLAAELGFDAEFIEQVPLINRPGVRFANQARFHPLKYLSTLVARIPGRGSHVYEHSEATQFERDGDIVRVIAGGYPVTCESVVMATDVPLTGLSSTASAAALQTKITGYTSYVVGAKLPNRIEHEASFWDTSDPYFYLRIDRQKSRSYAIFGGLDHKTGQARHTNRFFVELEKNLRRYIPDAKVDRHWSGQVIESHDGLPLIGETAERQYVATGYSGNGITFGMVAAMIIRDAIMGRKNPWSELFDPTRKQVRRGAWNYVRENLEYPYYMVKDRIAKSQGKSLRSLKRGEGKILRLKGRRVAAYRDARGNVSVSSAVCPHMGCIVHWNEAESTWDCPCHGSRFEAIGKLLAGPAEASLEAIPKPSRSD